MTDVVRLDLHVHSDRSPDSRLSLDAIVRQLPGAGLRGFALTDHNTLDGHAELASLATRHPDLLLLPGVEVSTLEGHLLAFGVGQLPRPHRPVLETIAGVHAQGGVCVLAHPFRWFHGVGRSVAETAPVPALESLNGHTARRTNAKAEHLALRRRLATTGGSDAHELSDLGRAYTEFADAPSTVPELLEALKGGRTRARGRSLEGVARIRVSLGNAGRFFRRGLRPI